MWMLLYVQVSPPNQTKTFRQPREIELVVQNHKQGYITSLSYLSYILHHLYFYLKPALGEITKKSKIWELVPNINLGTLYFFIPSPTPPPLDEFGTLILVSLVFFTLRAPNKGGNFHLIVVLILMVAN